MRDIINEKLFLKNKTTHASTPNITNLQSLHFKKFINIGDFS